MATRKRTKRVRPIRKVQAERPQKNYRKQSKLLLAGSIFLLLLSYTNKGKIKSHTLINKQLLNEPLQTETTDEAFDVLYRNRSYNIKPLFEYELWGLVVSHNDPYGWGDIQHNENSFDTRDLCVIWGNNLRSDHFSEVEFKSGSFTCYYHYKSADLFHPENLSNNHLITDSDFIREKIARVKIGDQIHIKGKLVDYQMNGRSFVRKTSTNRTDRGNGACEIIFVEELETIKKGTTLWYSLFNLSKYLLIFSILFFGWQMVATDPYELD